MNRSTAVACFGIATLLLTAAGAQSAYACPSPPRQESTLHQNIPSFETEQADVRDVLRKLFKTTQSSYTIAPDVQGAVTISLKNVTFETALQNVLRQVDATYRIEGGVVCIVRHDNPVVSDIISFSGPVDPIGPPTHPRPPAPPKEAPSIVQDGQFLYIIKGSSMFKVRKSDLKVVAKGKLPG